MGKKVSTLHDWRIWPNKIILMVVKSKLKMNLPSSHWCCGYMAEACPGYSISLPLLPLPLLLLQKEDDVLSYRIVIPGDQ